MTPQWHTLDDITDATIKPWDFGRIEVYCKGWKRPIVTSWRQVGLRADIVGLIWRPLGDQPTDTAAMMEAAERANPSLFDSTPEDP